MSALLKELLRISVLLQVAVLYRILLSLAIAVSAKCILRAHMLVVEISKIFSKTLLPSVLPLFSIVSVNAFQVIHYFYFCFIFNLICYGSFG